MTSLNNVRSQENRFWCLFLLLLSSTLLAAWLVVVTATAPAYREEGLFNRNQRQFDKNASSSQACDPSPCQNGGVCVRAGASFGGYTCTCLEGYQGKRCESTIPINPAPFDLFKFRDVLDKSNFQAPYSTPAVVKAGEWDDYESSEYLYVTDRKYMTFVHERDTVGTSRSELRHVTHWDPTTPSIKRLQATVRLRIPQADNVESYTFVQIHNKDYVGYPGGPPLRIIWIRERKGLKDQLWANIRTGLNPKANEFIHLGPRPTGFFRIDVAHRNSQLIVAIDGKVHPEFDLRDVSQLDPLPEHYFKIGVYLHESVGPAILDVDEVYIEADGETFTGG